jgi:hypothetical protein
MSSLPGLHAIGIPMPTVVYRFYSVYHVPPCPFAAFTGGVLCMAAWAAADWQALTGQAVAAGAFVSVAGGSLAAGIVWIVHKYDQIKIERQKKYEEANKGSLSDQIAKLTENSVEAARVSEANQMRMRESMHSIINEASAAKAENANLHDELATLRTDFMSMSRELRATYEEVRKTRDLLQQATHALEDSERDRRSLRAQIEALQQGQGLQERRLNALELIGSGENIPIPKALLQPPPTKGPVP